MARPRSFDRDRALDTAMHLFWERGFDHVSITDLTAAIGIAPPSLYAAFGDKSALFAEAVEHYISRPENFMIGSLSEPTARGSIARLLHDSAIQHTRPDRPRGCLVLSEPLLGDHRAASRQIIAARIQSGVDAGELPAGTDVARLSRYLLAVLIGLSNQARDGAGTEELLDVADQAMLAWPTPA